MIRRRRRRSFCSCSWFCSSFIVFQLYIDVYPFIFELLTLYLDGVPLRRLCMIRRRRRSFYSSCSFILSTLPLPSFPALYQHLTSYLWTFNILSPSKHLCMRITDKEAEEKEEKEYLASFSPLYQSQPAPRPVTPRPVPPRPLGYSRGENEKPQPWNPPPLLPSLAHRCRAWVHYAEERVGEVAAPPTTRTPPVKAS